jgi:ArsR family transcriptional regulator, arsenate/arsenite/antimonite-responsive transcriptional repressor
MNAAPYPSLMSLDHECAEEAARVFKALSDPIRLHLLSQIISCAGQPCVLDISAGLTVSAPTISYHLKVLREAGLINSVRRGTSLYYRADLQVLSRFGALLTCC